MLPRGNHNRWPRSAKAQTEEINDKTGTNPELESRGRSEASGVPVWPRPANPTSVFAPSRDAGKSCRRRAGRARARPSHGPLRSRPARRGLLSCSGGWGGIRTHEALADLPVFKTGALNRSATHPVRRDRALPESPLKPCSQACLYHHGTPRPPGSSRRHGIRDGASS